MTPQLRQSLQKALGLLERGDILGEVAAASILRSVLAEPVFSQQEPVHGDVLPPIGSTVYIRHGRDDDAHACTVTGYFAWVDLEGSNLLHRVFVQMVYEGTDVRQARLLRDCYATAAEALAGGAR